MHEKPKRKIITLNGKFGKRNSVQKKFMSTSSELLYGNHDMARLMQNFSIVNSLTSL